ncbi:nuclear transport factor 2 family protein [Methylorubrum sp. Q1]|uniref:nuclear transport factor 2 family protein n=1 Tax=Methylorubrum sp. Q1 TaxID=2562453 RepID=UPI00187D14F1|nr:nuclear transport factor 2 family protein [Methylorubrum sp. Q1]
MQKDEKSSSCRSAAHKTLEQWIAAVEKLSVDDTTRLYTENALLVPTLEDGVPNTPATRRAYFEKFLSQDSLSCKIDLQVDHASGKDDAVLIGGLYTFEIIKNRKKEIIPARFLFVFEEFDGQWLITGHHSSRQKSVDKTQFLF